MIVDWERPFWYKDEFFASHGEVLGENIFRLARRSFGAKNVSPYTANFRAKTSFASYGEVSGENVFRFGEV